MAETAALSTQIFEFFQFQDLIKLKKNIYIYMEITKRNI